MTLLSAQATPRRKLTPAAIAALKKKEDTKELTSGVMRFLEKEDAEERRSRQELRDTFKMLTTQMSETRRENAETRRENAETSKLLAQSIQQNQQALALMASFVQGVSQQRP